MAITTEATHQVQEGSIQKYLVKCGMHFACFPPCSH